VPVDALNERFRIPGVVSFERGEGGLARVVVTTPSATGHVYLHGAHVTHYQPRGTSPVLFISPRSLYAAGRAIRGGVPVIFPWFGPHPTEAHAPEHGFARVLEWTVEAVEEGGDDTTVVFGLEPSPATRTTWPPAFRLHYRATFGRVLALALEVENRADQPVTFQEALHTYCRVGDVEAVTVRGLEAVTYIDKADGLRRKVEGVTGTRIRALTDRVYLDTTGTCVVDDPTLGRRLRVEKAGSRSTVVWNPGADRARAMADLDPDAWRSMLCVEAANVADNAVRLAPGERHSMRTQISVVEGQGAQAPRAS
jgi:glucose-6-phosphate 1-epimerase